MALQSDRRAFLKGGAALALLVSPVAASAATDLTGTLGSREKDEELSLEVQTKVIQTKDGLYQVTYTYTQKPLNVQEAAYAVAKPKLDMVSIARLGYLGASVSGEDNPFLVYSRTNIDVFNDMREKAKPRVVLIPGEALSRQFLHDLVETHNRSREYVLPYEQRELAYATVDAMIANGEAFATTHGTHEIPSSKLEQNELANFLFSDTSLGMSAAKRGDFLIRRGIDVQRIFLDDIKYALSQRGPYVNRLRAHGLEDEFCVSGNLPDLGKYLGAFAARFEKIAARNPNTI